MPCSTGRWLCIRADCKLKSFNFPSLAAQAESVNVTVSITDRGIFEPDPAQQVMVRDQTLDAYPGRPGMPVSIPGMPVESPAGGVKTCSFFALSSGSAGRDRCIWFNFFGFAPTASLPLASREFGMGDWACREVGWHDNQM